MGDCFKERQAVSAKGLLLSVSITGGVVPAESLDRKNNSSKDKSHYKVVKRCDIAYNTMRMWQGASGVSKHSGIVSPAYTVLMPRFGTNSDFFAQLFRSPKMIHAFQNRSQGSTSDTWNLKYQSLTEIGIFAPNIFEQQNVSKLFTLLDNLIAAQERKLQLLKQKKIYYLQQIFSQKLRFGGFSDPWELRKLGELAARHIGGGTPDTSRKKYWNGRIPWIQNSDLTNNDPNIFCVQKHISFEGLQASSANLVAKDSIAIVTRVGVGKVAHIPFQYSSSQDILNLSQIQNDIIFDSYAILRLMEEKAKQVQGTSVKGVSQASVIKSSIALPPNKSEQEIVGRLFQTLDNLITAQERKLQLLQRKKQAYLQNMFI